MGAKRTLFRPPQALVIGRDDFAIDQIIDTLQAEGFKVHGSPDPASALRALKKARPDLLVVAFDTLAAESLGIALAARAAWNPRTLPILLVAGVPARLAEKASSMCLANGYVTTPLHGSEFAELARSTMEVAG